MSGLFKDGDLPEIKMEHLPAPWSVKISPTNIAWIYAANGQPVLHAAPELARRIVKAVNEAEAEPTAGGLEAAVDYWNYRAQACGLPQVAVMNPERRKKLARRIKEAGGQHGFEQAIERVTRSAFLCGQNDRRWKASFDFILQQESFARLLDGKYDDTSGNDYLDFLQNGGTRGLSAGEPETDGAARSPQLHRGAAAPEDARGLPAPGRRKIE